MAPPIKKPNKLPPTATVRHILAHNLRLLRYEQHLSQEDLALACELDRTYVSAVERQVWNVSLANIEKIARVLGVEPWMLLHPSCDKTS